MKRMIRYGMKPVRYRIVVINVLLALGADAAREVFVLSDRSGSPGAPPA